MVSFGAGLVVSGQHNGNILLTRVSQKTETQRYRVTEKSCVGKC